MKNLKILGMFMVGMFIFSSLCAVYSVAAVGIEGFSAKKKLPALVSDVLGLDLSKYTITEERYKPRYEYDGAVEVEYCGFTLVDKKGGEVSVMSEFYNGFPEWVMISPSTGSLYYAIAPPDGSVEQLKNVFERYVAFAKKYDIDTVNASLALNLFSKAPSSLPKSELSPAIVSLDDMSLYISQKSFGFGPIINGVEVPNKSLGIVFNEDSILLRDTFELYSIYGLGVFSEETFTNFAFDLAQNFCEDHLFYRTDDEGVQIEVRPDWSNMRTEVSFFMLPGQIYNDSINDELLEQDVGVKSSADRDALTLYPFWSAVFYFSYPIGNVYGVQVGVWGDTGEVVYCWEQGFLGGSQNISDGSSYEQANSFGNLLGPTLIALVAIVTIIAVVVLAKKKRK